MIGNEFQRSVSSDSAPRGSQCEWCGKPATSHLTAIGGASHNDSGLFCSECGEKFTQTIAQATISAHTTSYSAR
jgi:DNA-directed RNA polymerase subunit RPC12/RpoP